MTELVDEIGYRRTSVGEIIARAGISRTTFYRLFEDRADCFHAAHRRAIGQIDRALRSSEGLDALYELVRSQPGLAAVAFEACRVSGPGPEGNYLKTSRRWSERLASHPKLLEHRPSGEGLPPEIDQMALGGVTTVLARRVATATGSGASDEADLDCLRFLALLPYRGPGQAISRSARRNG